MAVDEKQVRARRERETRVVRTSGPIPVEIKPEQLRALLEALRPPPKPQGKTFLELAEQWRATVARVWPAKEKSHLDHLRELHHLREDDLTVARAKLVFASLLKPAGPLGPNMLNKVRSTGKLIIQDAQENGEWGPINPFERVKRKKHARKQGLSVTIEEARAFLPYQRRDRRWLSLLMLYCGLRPGEMFGLHKTAVDLERGTIRVWRSHYRDETKTGEERTVFIPDELVSELRAAMEASPSEVFVFATPDGRQWRPDTKLARCLHEPFRKAGLVTGYNYKCRRKGCGVVEYREKRQEGFRCPACGFKLWEVSVPKNVWFYHLRHSCATLHREAGADPLAIKLALGHMKLSVTDEVYTHLTPAYLRGELNKLRLRPPDGWEEKNLTDGQKRGSGRPRLTKESTVTASSLRARRDSNPRPSDSKSEGRGFEKPDLNSQGLAEVLGINIWKARELIRQGHFPNAYRIGLDARIPHSDVEAFKARGGAPGPGMLVLQAKRPADPLRSSGSGVQDPPEEPSPDPTS